MPYMLLIVEPPGQREERTLAQGMAAYERMVGFAQDLDRRGVLIATHSLRKEASRVSTRTGKPSVVDGPFAEAKEFIGGFFLLSCTTREEALSLASQCPAAEWATIEVREVGTCYE
jgi:hypothetical protein